MCSTFIVKNTLRHLLVTPYESHIYIRKYEYHSHVWHLNVSISYIELNNALMLHPAGGGETGDLTRGRSREIPGFALKNESSYGFRWIIIRLFISLIWTRILIVVPTSDQKPRNSRHHRRENQATSESSWPKYPELSLLSPRAPRVS